MLRYDTFFGGEAGVGPAPVSADPFFNDVVWMLRGEGADGSTTFTDRSLYGRTNTSFGIENDENIDVEGTPSIHSINDDDRVTGQFSGEVTIRPTHPDFCLEMYGRFESFSGVQRLIMRRNVSSSSNWGWFLSNDNFGFAFWRSNGAQLTQFLIPHGMSINTIHHIACIRQGFTYYAFRDGVLVGSATPTVVTNEAYNNEPITLGQSDTNFSNRHIQGNVNHVRATIGNTRYNVAGFTPDNVPHLTSRLARVATPIIADNSDKFVHLRAEEAVLGATSLTNLGAGSVTATILGGGAVTDTEAKFGTKSIRLDNNDYIQLTSAPTSLLEYNDPTVVKSMSFWVRPDAVSGAGDQTIFSRNNNTLEDDLTLRLDDGGGLRLLLRSAGAVVMDLRPETGVLSAATWHHIAIQAGGNFYALYVDGLLWGKATYEESIGSTNGDDLLFGRDENASGNDFAGYIDEIVMTNSNLFVADFNKPTLPVPYTQ